MKEGTQQKNKEEREKNNRMQGVCWHVFLEISLLQEGFLCSFAFARHASTQSILYIYPFLCIFIQSFSLIFIYLFIFAYLCPYLVEKSVLFPMRNRREECDPSPAATTIGLRRKWRECVRESNEDEEQEKGGGVLRSEEV